MKIEVVLTEAEVAQEFAEAMEARDLPEKFFYWTPRSVLAWKVLAHESGYMVDLNRSWKQVAAKLPELVPHFGKRASVISFGAGDGLKDRVLIHALQEGGFAASYFPVDASQMLLETACAGGEDDDIETVGIKADISAPPHLIFAADAADSPRLLIMAGNTLGGFDPLSEIRAVAQCLGNGDRLLIDGEMRREDSLERRDIAAVRECAFAPLASVGFSTDDGELRYEQKRDERHDGLFMITRHFRVNRDLRAAMPSGEILIQKGERIAMNFQYVYTPEAFHWLLEKYAGLKILEAFPSPEGRFVTVMCERPA